MPLVCSFYLAAAYVDQLLNLRSPTDHSVLSDTRRMERHLNHLHLFQQMIIYFHRVLHALTTSPRHWEGHRLVQLGWSLDPLLKYLPPRWWALAKIPLFSSEETSWPGPPVNDYRKELTPLLQSGWNQEMSDFAPSPFSIRETWILTQARWFSGGWVHHLLCQLTFSIKSLFLFPTSRLSTYWPVGWWTVWVWTAEQSCIW